MALGAIADAELDAEVHAEADEQHGECHRDEIERAIDEESERRGDRHADQQADQDRGDQAAGTKRHPQQRGHDQHRHDGVEAGALGERREFLVGERDGTGEPNAYARIVGESASRARRRESPRRRARRAASAPKSSLGCTRMKRRNSRGSGARPMISVRHEKRGTCPALTASIASANAASGRVRSVELDLSPAHAFEHERQRVHDTAQTWIGRQRSEQRLRSDDLLRRARHFLHGREQQSRAIEERSAVGPPQRMKCRRVAGEPLRERGRGLLGQVGRGAVDHDGDHGHALRKRFGEVDLALPPRKVRRDQVGGVGVDRDVPHGVDRGNRAQHRGDEQHEPRARRTTADHARDQRSHTSTPIRVIVDVPRTPGCWSVRGALPRATALFGGAGRLVAGPATRHDCTDGVLGRASP